MRRLTDRQENQDFRMWHEALTSASPLSLALHQTWSKPNCFGDRLLSYSICQWSEIRIEAFAPSIFGHQYSLLQYRLQKNSTDERTVSTLRSGISTSNSDIFYSGKNDSSIMPLLTSIVQSQGSEILAQNPSLDVQIDLFTSKTTISVFTLVWRSAVTKFHLSEPKNRRNGYHGRS